MASKTAIGNRALSKLGQTRVSNIDTEDTKGAKVIRYMWDLVRDAVLQAYPWKFAIKRVSLAVSGTPAWGYTYEYTLPSDYLSMVEMRYDLDYKIENGKILTDENTIIYIRYVARIENTGEWTPLFNEAFATRLAFEGCEEITQSNTKKQILGAELQEVIDLAYRTDAIENPPVEYPADDWLTVRA